MTLTDEGKSGVVSVRLVINAISKAEHISSNSKGSQV